MSLRREGSVASVLFRRLAEKVTAKAPMTSIVDFTASNGGVVSMGTSIRELPRLIEETASKFGMYGDDLFLKPIFFFFETSETDRF